MSADTTVCQQGAAVSYGQEGNLFSGLDSMLKSPTDTNIAALPGAGVAVMGPAAPGVCLLSTELHLAFRQEIKPLISCARLLLNLTAAVSPPSASVGSQRLLAHNQVAVLATDVATPATQVHLVIGISFSTF